MLFSDIVGSTKLKQTLGEHVALESIQRHHTLFREELRDFREAEEISTAGDAFFIVFAKPSDAVKFALRVQAGLRQIAQESSHPVFDRIGIHVGEVWVEGGDGSKDLYGIQVDTCARVCALGGADQILLTRFPFDSARQVLRGDLKSMGSLTWLNHGAYLAKGVDDPVEICEVGETGKARLAQPPDTDKARRYISADAEPVLGWRPAVDQPVPGTSWVLEKKLGEGGFGEVWLGRDKILKTLHVFKFCFRADRVRSLKREVTLFRLLKDRIGQHPNIVGVEATYFDEPPYYIVVHHVEGSDLSVWCTNQGGPDLVPLAVRLEIVAQAADALQAAHDSGVIHRDVKPSNILVSGSGADIHVHLTDFGIGQVVSEEALAGVTRMGFTQTIVESASQSGTRLYMAPELFAGKPASIRSDIYALGVVLFQLLTGDFTRPVTTDWARQIADPLLREDLEKCFAGDPQERFAGAAQLAQRLRAIERRRAAFEKERAVLAARERAAYRRGILWTAAVAAAVVAAMVLLAAYAFRQRRAERVQRLVAEEQTKVAETAATHARETLSRFHFLQALRSIDENRNYDALAQLARSLSVNPQNDAAICRLTTLLIYHSFALPISRMNNRKGTSSALFSPDGKRVVIASNDNTARVWDARSGQQLTGPLEHGDAVNSVQFSPDGKWIVTASDDTVRVWDAQTGQPLTGPLRQGYLVQHVRFSPDGKRIVIAARDERGGTARVWDVQSGQPLTEPVKHHAKFYPAQFSPDGKWIMTMWDDLQVWNVQSGEALSEPLQHRAEVHSAQFSPDGKRIVTASMDGTAGVWDARSGQPLTGPLQHGDAVNSAQFSLDGKRVVTGSVDGTARVWDAQSGQPLTGPLQHGAAVDSAEFSLDGKWIVTASKDKTARVWDAQSGQPLTEPLPHDEGVRSARFSPDRKSIVTASGDAARVWDAQSSQPLSEPLRHDAWVSSVQFSPDGKRIVVGSGAGQFGVARVYDAQSGKQLAEMLFEYEGKVSSAQFSPDGKRVVTASMDGTARVWDAQSGQPLTGPLRHDAWVSSVQFSPDGKWIVTASMDGTARVWDAQSGQPLTGPLQHGVAVDSTDFRLDGKPSAQFSPDRKRIVVASGADTAQVWDISARGEAPAWLPRLAEAVAGQRLNDRGVFQPLIEDPARVLEEIRAQLDRAKTDDDWTIVGRWFLADRSTRTISPFSRITVPDYIENRIKEGTLRSLDEASRLAVGDAELSKRIAEARKRIVEEERSGAQREAPRVP